MASEFLELPPAFSSVHTRCACSVRPGATDAPNPKAQSTIGMAIGLISGVNAWTSAVLPECAST